MLNIVKGLKGEGGYGYSLIKYLLYQYVKKSKDLKGGDVFITQSFIPKPRMKMGWLWINMLNILRGWKEMGATDYSSLTLLSQSHQLVVSMLNHLWSNTNGLFHISIFCDMMQIVDLRRELECRSVSSKGLKSQLIARLTKALKTEQEKEEEQEATEAVSGQLMIHL